MQEINPFNRSDAFPAFIDAIVEHLHQNKHHLPNYWPNRCQVFHVVAFTKFSLVHKLNSTIVFSYFRLIHTANCFKLGIIAIRTELREFVRFVSTTWKQLTVICSWSMVGLLLSYTIVSTAKWKKSFYSEWIATTFYMCHKLHNVRSLSKNEFGFRCCVSMHWTYATASVYLPTCLPAIQPTIDVSVPHRECVYTRIPLH